MEDAPALQRDDSRADTLTTRDAGPSMSAKPEIASERHENDGRGTLHNQKR